VNEVRTTSGRKSARRSSIFDPRTYPDHLFLYTGRVDSFTYAATRPPQWPPNAVGRYRNTDPVLINYLVRLAVEKRGEEYLSFPQRQLFDKIGVRSMVMETDPYQGVRPGTESLRKALAILLEGVPARPAVSARMAP
jgi:hypothetical protein